MDELTKSFTSKLSISYKSPSDPSPTLNEVKDLQDFEKTLTILCENVYKTLGIHELEATYQRALKLEMTLLGLSVASEVSTPILYKGTPVGSRRADLIVTLPNKEEVILELKAISALSSGNVKQLEYYMKHFRIETGYLINFPHETGFPEVEDIFTLTDIVGSSNLTDRSKRSSKKELQIVRVVKLKKGSILDLDKLEGEEANDNN